MRVVVDLQACQSHASRNRGIGRYSLALLKAMLHQAGDDEVWVALNGELPGTIEPVRAALDNLIPQSRIVVWRAVSGFSAELPANDWRRNAAAQVRQSFLENLAPDVVHVSSWFEGFIDDTLTSPGVSTPGYRTAVTLYDLIPLVHDKIYLGHPRLREWYLRKTEELGRADLLLGISAHTCREAMERLALPVERIANISAAIDPLFRTIELAAEDQAALRARLGLLRSFLMYTGGIDPRKDIEGLIDAYARLPAALRRIRQLAIVCHASAESIERLQRIGADAGLLPGELVLTGYVSDEDLLALYNLCEAFVFPSWHEGFGLPVLEAMACGAPVIAANTSSIPEVVGCDAALFEPRSARAMAGKIEQVLSDASFRERMREHGLQQAKLFSWERCAQASWQAIRALRSKPESASCEIASSDRALPRLAYVAPLPPERSGVADYSAELLPELARFYRIEVISDQSQISDPWLREHVPLRSTAWFEECAGEFDRVLYHMGNGLLHANMLTMVERHPGTVVLHEIYLSGIAAHVEWASKVPGYWTRALYESHGYPALIAREATSDPEKMLERYPCSLPVIHEARGVIVHSQFARSLAEEWYGAGISRDWTVIPHLRAVPEQGTRAAARRRLRLADDDLLVCCFGILGVFKRNREIIEGWLASALAADERCRLVFVGGSLSPVYEDELRKLIADSGSGRITITGWADQRTYRDHLAAADIAVQLRGCSRGEASGTVHDCMAYGVATVVNAHGPFQELPHGAVWTIPDDFGPQDLAQGLQALAADIALRKSLGDAGSAYCRDELQPQRIAALYHDAIEAAAAAPRNDPAKLAAVIAEATRGVQPGSIDVERLAAGIASNEPPLPGIRQLLVDVSELVRRDAKSGIQRVVRSVLDVLLKTPPQGFRVEPVYAEPGERYRYARAFTAKFLGLTHPLPADEPIDTDAGDVFLGLDLAMVEISANLAQFEVMRDRGVRSYFIVHDVLPVARADCFAPHIRDIYANWVEAFVKIGDGAICVSRTVADELRLHLDAIQARRERPFQIGWFHHGADIGSSVPTHGITAEEADRLMRLRQAQSMLTVGTLEPRKGHLQALDAFELLWLQGSSARWVIVGKPGWMTEALVERLRNHPEKDSRLFWFEGASDELLMRLYEQCSGLLVPSEGEGFGLPLIEAAQHGLPILCRDLPVFKEVAGPHASYFSGFEAAELADAIRDWLAHRANDAVPTSASMPRLTWEQATAKLLDCVLGEHWHASWMPDQRYMFPVYERRMAMPVGERRHDRVESHGVGGVLLKSWRAALIKGRYGVKLRGEWLQASGNARLELADSRGELLGSWNLEVGHPVNREFMLETELDLHHDLANLIWRVVVEPGTYIAIARWQLERLQVRQASLTPQVLEPSRRAIQA